MRALWTCRCDELNLLPVCKYLSTITYFLIASSVMLRDFDLCCQCANFSSYKGLYISSKRSSAWCTILFIFNTQFSVCVCVCGCRCMCGCPIGHTALLQSSEFILWPIRLLPSLVSVLYVMSRHELFAKHAMKQDFSESWIDTGLPRALWRDPTHTLVLAMWWQEWQARPDLPD